MCPKTPTSSIRNSKSFLLPYSMWHIVYPSSLNKRHKTMLKRYITRNYRRLADNFKLIKLILIVWWFLFTNELTIRYNEDAAKASGIATDVILSYGPFKYVCLGTCWKYFCFSTSFSRGLKGGSDILHNVVDNFPLNAFPHHKDGGNYKGKMAWKTSKIVHLEKRNHLYLTQT